MQTVFVFETIQCCFSRVRGTKICFSPNHVLKRSGSPGHGRHPGTVLQRLISTRIEVVLRTIIIARKRDVIELKFSRDTTYSTTVSFKNSVDRDWWVVSQISRPLSKLNSIFLFP